MSLYIHCVYSYHLSSYSSTIHYTNHLHPIAAVLLVVFFNCYLAAPWPTLGHYRGVSLTHLMLITGVLHIQPEGHWEPRNEVGSLSVADCLVGFELGTF